MGSPAKSKTDLTDEQTDDNGVLFWLNKSGFPLDGFTWDRMWNHVERIHPDGSEVRKKMKNSSLKPIPIPHAPLNPSKNASIQDRIDAVQKYMVDLQYNHTGTQFFEIRKNRPISGLMDVARDMVKDSLPIKCLEAIILGVYLTNGYPGLERFPISFKSCFNGNVHRHVVLGVYHAGKFGAIGMSRRDDLMYKPLQFKCLSDLVFDFHECYKKYWHTLKKMKIGLPIPHDPHSFEPIIWKCLTLNIHTMTRADVIRDTEKHAKEIRTQSRLREQYDSSSGQRRSSKAAVVSTSGSPRRSSFANPGSPTRARKGSGNSRSMHELRRTSSLVEGLAADNGSKMAADYQIRM